MIKSNSCGARYFFVDPRTKRGYERLSFYVDDGDLVNFFRVITQANPDQLRISGVYPHPDSKFFEIFYEETCEKPKRSFEQSEQKSVRALCEAGLLSD